MITDQRFGTRSLVENFQNPFGSEAGLSLATSGHFEQQAIADAETSADQTAEFVVHQAHRLPTVVVATESARVRQFRRVLQTGLQRHALIVTLFIGLLLVFALSLNATNAAVFAGLIGYLLGSLASAGVLYQAIQNAAYRDARS